MGLVNLDTLMPWLPTAREVKCTFHDLELVRKKLEAYVCSG